MQIKITASRKTIWVLGGGHFGRQAVQKLKKNALSCNIVVVDKNPIQDLPVDVKFVCADGVEWLAEYLTQDACVDKIIPALPLHLAADWVKKKLSEECRLVSPATIPDKLMQLFSKPHSFKS